MAQGTITAIKDRSGYGFIQRPGNLPDIFFHAYDLAGDLEFEPALLERFVTFDERHTDKGLRAVNVRAAD